MKFTIDEPIINPIHNVGGQVYSYQLFVKVCKNDFEIIPHLITVGPDYLEILEGALFFAKRKVIFTYEDYMTWTSKIIKGIKNMDESATVLRLEENADIPPQDDAYVNLELVRY